MKSLVHKSVYVVFGVILLLLLTYFRENILLEINANLALEEYNRAYSYWFADYFKGMSRDSLIKWKWTATIVFSFLMSAITICSLYIFFTSFNVLKRVLIIYLIIFIIGFLLAVIGYLTGSFNEVYFVLRKILGIVQSPLPFFAFFVLFYYEKRLS